MPQSSGHTRICPTRIDGAASLFTHKVTLGQCQDRQRGRYHKCYTCAYNNGHVAQNGTSARRVGPKKTAAAEKVAVKPKPVFAARA